MIDKPLDIYGNIIEEADAVIVDDPDSTEDAWPYGYVGTVTDIRTDYYGSFEILVKNEIDLESYWIRTSYIEVLNKYKNNN